MGKNKRKKMIGISLLILATISVLAVLITLLFKGNTTGDITINNNSGSIMGLKCTDTALIHPVFVDVQPISYTNTVTANFANNKLSSIMYHYDGIYQSANKAIHARNSAEADHNLILADDYGVDIDIFSHSFMTNDEKLALTITGNADKVTPKTASYFLLDALTEVPETLEELQRIYETEGFSCIVKNKE